MREVYVVHISAAQLGGISIHTSMSGFDLFCFDKTCFKQIPELEQKQCGATIQYKSISSGHPVFLFKS